MMYVFAKIPGVVRGDQMLSHSLIKEKTKHSFGQFGKVSCQGGPCLEDSIVIPGPGHCLHQGAEYLIC